MPTPIFLLKCPVLSAQIVIQDMDNRKEFTIISGTVRSQNFLYISLQNDDLAKQNIPIGFPMVYAENSWFKIPSIDFNPIDMSVCQEPLEQMILIGEAGQFFYLGSDEEITSEIVINGIKPKQRGGLIRCVKGIGRKVYAAGMNRVVYRREDTHDWVAIDESCYTNNSGVVGFEAIDGFSETDIYAVGWNGEIWHYDGQKWTQKESPTDRILTDVCCAEDGSVYISGQSGILIKGRDNKWELIQSELKTDFWSVVYYKESLYISSYVCLFELKNDSLEPLNLGEVTTYKLSSADGVLCSYGAKDVMLFDGTDWQELNWYGN